MDSLTLTLNVKTQEVRQNLCDTNDQLQTYSLELTIVYNYSIVDLEEQKKELVTVNRQLVKVQNEN
jgi:hypothetical protein